MNISHALVYFQDKMYSQKPFFVRSIEDVKENEEDTMHIKPNYATDFDAKKIYFGKWLCDPTCDADNCTHYGYYPCFIVLLGTSKDDIKEKQKLHKRYSIPRIIKDLGNLDNNDSTTKTSKPIIKSCVVLKNRSQSVLDELKENYKVSELVDNDSDEETATAQDNGSILKLKNVEVSLNKLPSTCAQDKSYPVKETLIGTGNTVDQEQTGSKSMYIQKPSASALKPTINIPASYSRGKCLYTGVYSH